MIKQDIYRCWTGGECDVIGVALDRDSKQEVVIYRPRYGARKLEYMTVQKFTEYIKHDDYEGPRYSLLMSNQKGLL